MNSWTQTSTTSSVVRSWKKLWKFVLGAKFGGSLQPGLWKLAQFLCFFLNPKCPAHTVCEIM